MNSETVCSSCGAKLEPKDKFCPECGAKQVPAVSTITYKPTPLQRKYNVFEKESRTRTLRILLVISGLFPFMGWILYVYYRAKSMRELASIYGLMGWISFAFNLSLAFGFGFGALGLVSAVLFIFYALIEIAKSWMKIKELVDTGKA